VDKTNLDHKDLYGQKKNRLCVLLSAFPWFSMIMISNLFY